MSTHNIRFMENCRKLSFNYHQIPTLSVNLVPSPLYKHFLGVFSIAHQAHSTSILNDINTTININAVKNRGSLCTSL